MMPSPSLDHSLNDDASIQHIAMIMDGNGRWARQKGLPRTMGHKKGADTLKKTCEYCMEAGIKYLTVYAFSSENWQRSSDEVESLMNLLRHYMKHETKTLHQNGVRIRVIGDRSLLDEDICQQIESVEAQTVSNQKLTAVIALSYGGRQEIVRAMQRLYQEVARGTVAIDAITPEIVEQYLDAQDIPHPDLLIRTGGETRISNFLLWQLAYTELYFTNTLWPDFNKQDFLAAIQEFQSRERRFGKA